MKWMKEILGRIFALWAAIVFSLFLLLIVLPVGILGIMKEPKKTTYSFIFFRFWMNMFFIFSGVRRKFIGRKEFKKGHTYIVVSNHRSLLDPPLSTPAIPTPSKTIAKIEMAKIPLFNIIYNRGSVLVDRKSEESRRRSYNQMKEVLSLGLHMCIYPEGTRNKTNQPLQRFHDGAFKLAVDTGKEIIPALIFNTDKVLPRKPFFFWPTKVEMHFLPAVSSTGKSVKYLKEEVYDVMMAYYTKHQ
jgi:1-acyl-sn-glycerol-3-phosphate acyltransferase